MPVSLLSWEDSIFQPHRGHAHSSVQPVSRKDLKKVLPPSAWREMGVEENPA
jgi:hypothetical protein